MDKLKRLLCVILLFMLISTLFGCIEKKDDITVADRNKNYLVYDIENQPDDLVELDKYNSRTKDLAKSLFEGLVYEKSDGSIGYGLAESCDVSKDGLVYTFHLRDDIKWSDGTNITANDFCDFFRDILNVKYKSQYRNELKVIFGEEDYINGNANFSNVAITAPEENKLQIRLNYPASYFLKILSQPIYGLREIDGKMNNWKKDYKAIKYTGPFKINSISSDGNINLEKNSYYVFKEQVKSDHIVLAQGTKGGAYSLADFETNNDIDIFFYPPAVEIDRLKKENEISFFDSFSIKALFFNLNSETAVSDENFRKAINYSIDKNELQNNSIGDYGRINNSFFPSSMNTSFKAITIPGNSPTDAVQYLKRSDYNNETIKIAYIDEDNNEKICEDIVNTINDSILKGSNSENLSGEKINFELDGYSSKDINDVIKDNDYDIYLGDYTIKYNDPMAFFQMWQTDYPSNNYGYSDTYYNDLLFEANITSDPMKKNVVYAKCIKELEDKLPVVPLYTKHIAVCSKAYVKGLQVDKYGDVSTESLFPDFNSN
jgi:peptide/nickel transport system substrate-binding protein